MKLNNVLFLLLHEIPFCRFTTDWCIFCSCCSPSNGESVNSPRTHFSTWRFCVCLCLCVYLASGFMHRLIQWFVIFDHSLLAQYFLSRFFFRFGFENVNICNGLHVRYISQVAMRIAKCKANEQKAVYDNVCSIRFFSFFIFLYSVKGVIRSASSKRKINEIESNPFNYSD